MAGVKPTGGCSFALAAEVIKEAMAINMEDVNRLGLRSEEWAINLFTKITPLFLMD